MYKILILYNKDHNLWKQYGTTTSGDKETFVEFATDDIEILQQEVLKLDRKIGFENIKIYRDISADYTVYIEKDEYSGINIATDKEVKEILDNVFNQSALNKLRSLAK